ncbi:MAG TPA: DUF4956 domain-containing protein [Pyrinomonadaceae bacterium]
MALNNKRKREVLTLVVVFAGVLLLSALAVYFVAGRRQPRGDSAREAVLSAPSPGASVARSPTPDDGGFIDQLLGGQQVEAPRSEAGWLQNVGTILFRFLLAALLGAALAFRPRKNILVLKRNPYVSQTQILLAIVAAALMIVVGDNAARAFGIFAAVSLVRFRTNIRDPKEVTVLLISLAIGLASGVGRYELALALVLFSLVVLWLLEWREASQVHRAMVVKVVTRNAAASQRALRQIFKKHGFDSELRGLQREKDETTAGSLVYTVDLSPAMSTDELSEDILSIDERNIDSIEWEQKKSFSYLYQ